MTSMPPTSVGLPKVKRWSPPITARPTVESRSPIQAPMMPFSMFPVDRAEIRVRPRTASQKYSGGPKARAIFASGGARSMRATAPTMPPVTEESVATVTARLPSPFLAIGKPSKVVAIEDGVPGVLTRMAAYEPP